VAVPRLLRQPLPQRRGPEAVERNAGILPGRHHHGSGENSRREWKWAGPNFFVFGLGLGFMLTGRAFTGLKVQKISWAKVWLELGL
jgi:hypothetical protein